MKQILLMASLLPVVMVAGCHEHRSIDFGGPVAGWTSATGSIGGGQFSPLTQIDKHNVGRLKVAWTYQSPDFYDGKPAPGQVGSHSSSNPESTPIIAGGKLVMCTPLHRVVALDPATGRPYWDYDPKMDQRVGSHFCRGVASWSEAQIDPGKPCQQRIFSTTGDGRLIALDLADGKLCADFGAQGSIDMKHDLGPLNATEYYQTAPPLVVKDLVLAGSAVRDGFRNDTAGGVVRAWDVRTGKLLWAWDAVGPTMPAVTADDVAAGKSFTRGTPNVWSFLSADVERGLIYLPTGNAPADHFKGMQRDIDYYGSSVVALDAANGKVVWAFQTVHHDLWDYDVPAQPVLYEYQGNIPALVVSTKMGHIFLLNRLTGKPIFPVVERTVPATDVAGEWSAPTQPFPTLPKPIFSDRITIDDVINYPYFSKGCRDIFASIRNEGLFTPPSLRGTLERPGIAGGLNWGSGSIDPASNTFITTVLDMPYIVKLIPRSAARPSDDGNGPVDWANSPQYGTPYAFQRGPFLSQNFVPCIKPPWGSIIAINLDSGQELWRKPLGSLRGQVPLIGSLLEVGSPAIGGNLQTASGIAFAAASADQTLRAFDSASGAELWKIKLPFSAHATPMTYRLTRQDKQYLVISTGGSPGLDAEVGNTLVAFALPD